MLYKLHDWFDVIDLKKIDEGGVLVGERNTPKMWKVLHTHNQNSDSMGDK